MGSYVPSTTLQKRGMLNAIGLPSMEALYAAVPPELIRKDNKEIPSGLSELEVSRLMRGMAARNTVFSTVFRGAGAYKHYIPAIVNTVVNKEAFVTAYTPYQPEISQGILQSIFEYQTMICELTGMDAANASVYDGATAAAEACAMCRDKKRSRVLISAASHPDVLAAVQTYGWAAGYAVEPIPTADGATDLAALADMLTEDTACVYLPQPNYFGVIENAERAAALVHEKGVKLIMGVNPIAAALLQSAGECGADIAVGEGQPLGMPLSFGGPYLGFMAATSAMARKLPGRIVGETTDSDGNRAFVLTLQAREQHIRREKASSNICSNQALCAMTAAVYMAAMGPEGLRQAAVQSMSKARYLAAALGGLDGFSLKHSRAFFHEFVTEKPADADEVLSYLEAQGVLGGLPLTDGILWCATELNTKAEIDALIALIKEARA